MHMFLYMGLRMYTVYPNCMRVWDGYRTSGHRVGMGTDTMGMEWGWGKNQWGHMGMGTILCPRALLYFEHLLN